MASAAPSSSFRRTTIGALLLLWLSGVVWIVFHYFFPVHTDFGPAPNPLEPVLMKVHGAIAVFAVALLGWVSARHIADNWPRTKKRKSGLAMVSAYILLVLSGYCLYYVLQDELRERIGQVHEVLGVISVAVATVHWFKTGSGKREMGNGKRETGSKRGNGELGTGNWERGTGNRK